MKIIKEGGFDTFRRIKRFECTRCGCIFEADETEYRSGSYYNETYYYCECPFCKRNTSNEIQCEN